MKVSTVKWLPLVIIFMVFMAGFFLILPEKGLAVTQSAQKAILGGILSNRNWR